MRGKAEVKGGALLNRLDFGIGLDVGLNVDEVSEEVISKFIDGFNAGRFVTILQADL